MFIASYFFLVSVPKSHFHFTDEETAVHRSLEIVQAHELQVSKIELKAPL